MGIFFDATSRNLAHIYKFDGLAGQMVERILLVLKVEREDSLCKSGKNGIREAIVTDNAYCMREPAVT